jgi:N-acetylmuramoyl-L-alanine amidase
MKIVISSGHGKHIRGASGYLDEVDEARRVVDRVAQLLADVGVSCKTFHDNTSTSQSTNLNTIVNYHNAQTRDLDVSVHFNAYQTTSKPMGTEVLYVTQSALADEVSAAISEAGGFIDRGPKKRTDLAFLNNTHEAAILIEVCFVDSLADEQAYLSHFNDICVAIAETIADVKVEETPPDPAEPEPEPPPAPVTGVVYNLDPGDTLNIRAAADGDAAIIGAADSGDRLMVVGSTGSWLKCSFGEQDARGVSVFGWASSDYVELQGELPEQAWHENITATVFGFEGDEQESAYGGWIDEDTIGVSFPYKWRDEPRPTRILIENMENGKQTEVNLVCDVGPWNTDDPDYVLGTARPLAEQQHEDGTKAQNGRVPTNNAGIDLTLPVATALGISIDEGHGKVRWRFA